jgi:hypothetical protein
MSDNIPDYVLARYADWEKCTWLHGDPAQRAHFNTAWDMGYLAAREPFPPAEAPVYYGFTAERELDPEPWLNPSTGNRSTLFSTYDTFSPRAGYEQDPSRYPGVIL